MAYMFCTQTSMTSQLNNRRSSQVPDFEKVAMLLEWSANYSLQSKKPLNMKLKHSAHNLDDGKVFKYSQNTHDPAND